MGDAQATASGRGGEGTGDLGEEIRGWLVGRLPDGWFTGPPSVQVDRDEILAVGTLPGVDLADGGPAALTAAQEARIARFREDTRTTRMHIASELEVRTGRKVSWGARCGDSTALFSTLAVPVMTRLRLPERTVLDTLIDGGVARSRSEALAWCVRLVGQHEEEWISRLRDALTDVQRVRAEGPDR